MNSEAPWRIYARLDSDSEAAWFVRLGYGRYVKWPLAANVLPVIVGAQRLTPVIADYHRFTGEAAAIAEVWRERMPPKLHRTDALELREAAERNERPGMPFV